MQSLAVDILPVRSIKNFHRLRAELYFPVHDEIHLMALNIFRVAAATAFFYFIFISI